MLKTKSLQKRKHPKDGLRVSVMRRIKPEHDFGLWLPKLAPSEKLLTAYVIDQTMEWDEFKPKFIKQLHKNLEYLKLIAKLAVKQDVTLLCWEEEPHRCHRSILIEECKKLDKKLKVKVR